MKLILLLITTLLFNAGYADLFSLPGNAFSVNVATGQWVESATEGETRRVWEGSAWQWQGDKKSSLYQFKDKQLIKVSPEGKAPIIYSYDKKGRISLRSEGDHFIEILYDSQGRVIEERSPLGKDLTPYPYARFKYSPQATEVTDALGVKKLYRFNAKNEVTDVEYYTPEGLYKIEKFKWEAGKLKKQTLLDKNGQELVVQKNVWNKEGKLAEQIITGKLTGHKESETYTQSLTMPHKNPNPPAALPAQDKTVYEYNKAGQMTMKTLPNGEAESYRWDGYGNLASRTTTKDGIEVTFTYDHMNRLIRESEGFSFEYDLAGRQTKQIDPEGNETEFVYDALGRMIEKIDPPVLSPSNEIIRPRSFWVYNELDQVVEAIDADSWSTKTTYTVRGQPVRIEHPNGQIEEHYYRLDGKPEDYKEPEKAETQESASPEEEAPPLPPPESEDTVITERVFNERGQKVIQKTFTDFIGIKSLRTFDALGRLEKVEKYDLLGDLFQTKEFRYTPAGLKACEITNGDHTEWTWGPMERLDAMTQHKGTSQERMTRLFYDSEGRLEHFVKPSGLSLSYSYDDQDSLIELISSDQSVRYHFTWEHGRLVKAEDLNTGKATHRTYDDKGQLIHEELANNLHMKWEEAATVLPDNSRIRYKRDDDRILREVTRESEEGEALYTHTYTLFDQWDHLAEEVMIKGLGTVSHRRDSEQRLISITSPYRQEKLKFDGIKLTELEINGIKTPFEYDAQFRLKKENKPCKFELDQEGNTVKSGAQSLKYDALGRLTEVDGVHRYDYDAFGRRIASHGPGGTKLFFWDGMEEIGIADTNGQIRELKVMGSHGVVAVELNGHAYATLLDAKGSIAGLAATDEISPWTYQGKRLDAETGFINLGARYLDPARGQFLTPDPKGFADGQDLYHFAKYNPNAFSDTWGHTSIIDGCRSVVKTGWNTLLRINQTLNEWRGWVNNFTGVQALHNKFEDAAYVLLGKGFLIQSGYYQQEIQTGVYGDQEYDPLIRVTFNHGILNIRSDLIENIRQISSTHGGVNVHYVYRPTAGFAWDVMKCLMVKTGYLSQEARELIRIWKGLIAEMGGPDAGGKIIHYSHSVGGADTAAALTHLTVAEQKMLDIRTFGSATLIPDRGTYKITNYASRGDAIFYLAWMFSKIEGGGLYSNILVGSVFGFGCDHPFSTESYQQVLKALGQAFLEAYSG